MLVLGVTACSSVDPSRQRLVAKPNMLFADTATFTYQNRLVPQTEPGSSISGGAQTGGCTSCK